MCCIRNLREEASYLTGYLLKVSISSLLPGKKKKRLQCQLSFRVMSELHFNLHLTVPLSPCVWSVTGSHLDFMEALNGRR